MFDKASTTDRIGVKAAQLIVLFWISYSILKIIYNLFFHPLSKFPGPKIAAIGKYYEFYYDVIKDGTYIWKIEEMHNKYGPVVRVNADELHVRDPEYYSTVYSGGAKRVDKWPDAVGAFTVPQATLATVDHDLHRVRRGLLNPYFSKRAAIMLEPTIDGMIDRLCDRLDEYVGTGKPVNLDGGLAALTADIVAFYFYGEDYRYLDAKDFKFAMREAILGVIKIYHFTRFAPALANFIKSLPIPVVRVLQPAAADLLEEQEKLKHDIQRTLNNKANVKSRSVIIGALEDPEIPAAEKTIERLVNEGQTVIFAGTETTARSMAVALFYLMWDKSLLKKLREELSTVPEESNGQRSYHSLENLPYLTGCVQEGVRLAQGPSVRLPRVSRDEALQHGDWLIPAGTPVSVSNVLTHLDASVFPNPKVFDPERWIRATEQGVHLSKYICSFTKGSRGCLGINLAYVEIYKVLAKLVMSYEMDLHDTTLDDVDVYRIRLTPLPKHGNGEIRAMFTSKV